MFFKWLDATAAITQANGAVQEIERLVPVEQAAGGDAGRTKLIQKLERTIDTHRRQYAAYNVYQKAKFANRIKWSLRDRGYPNAFVDSVVRLLII